MATNPAIAPLAAPRTVGFPRYIHSITIQVNAAAAVAVFVTTKALVANAPEATALGARGLERRKSRRPMSSTAA